MFNTTNTNTLSYSLNHCKEYVAASCGKKDGFSVFLSAVAHIVTMAKREKRNGEGRIAILFSFLILLSQC